MPLAHNPLLTFRQTPKNLISLVEIKPALLRSQPCTLCPKLLPRSTGTPHPPAMLVTRLGWMLHFTVWSKMCWIEFTDWEQKKKGKREMQGNKKSKLSMLSCKEWKDEKQVLLHLNSFCALALFKDPHQKEQEEIWVLLWDNSGAVQFETIWMKSNRQNICNFCKILLAEVKTILFCVSYTYDPSIYTSIFCFLSSTSLSPCLLASALTTTVKVFILNP